MIHQPIGGARGQATDIEIQAREIIFLRKRMNEILADAHRPGRGQDQRDIERDFYLSRRAGQGVRAHRRGARIRGRLKIWRGVTAHSVAGAPVRRRLVDCHGLKSFAG